MFFARSVSIIGRLLGIRVPHVGGPSKAHILFIYNIHGLEISIISARDSTPPIRVSTISTRISERRLRVLTTSARNSTPPIRISTTSTYAAKTLFRISTISTYVLRTRYRMSIISISISVFKPPIRILIGVSVASLIELIISEPAVPFCEVKITSTST